MEVTNGVHSAATTHVIGRDNEIGRVMAHYKLAEDGTGSAVLLRGEGGIGKSRVAAEVLARALPMGAVVLTGHASQFDRGLPHAMFKEIIASLPADLPADLVATARAIASTLSVAGSGGADVLSAAPSFFSTLADHEPLIVLWEDLHIADADSVSLFVRLSRQLNHSRVLFLGTLRSHRSAEIFELERLVEQLELEGRGAVIEVQALDRSDIRALVADRIGVDPVPAVVDFVYESSRGNPFFATETTRSLVASSSIVIADGRGRLVDGRRLLRPRTALVHRFFEIGSIDAAIAKVLSAFGRVSVRELPLVAAIAGVSEERVALSFDRLVAEQLLVRLIDGRYEFAHSILREALYEDVGPSEQRRIHRLIAQRLQRDADSGVDVDLTELATHVSECAERGDESAAHVLAQAGRATARTAPLVSARWFSKCADLLVPDSHERIEIMSLQSASMFMASRPRDAADLGLRVLEHMADGPDRTRTLIGTVNSLYICGELQAVIDILDEEERRSGPLSGPLFAQRAHFLVQLGCPDEVGVTSAQLRPESNPTKLAVMMCHDLHRATVGGDRKMASRLINDMLRISPSVSIQTQLTLDGTIALEAVSLGYFEHAKDALARASAIRGDERSISVAGLLETASIYLDVLQGRWDRALLAIPDLMWNLEHHQARIMEGMLLNFRCEMLLERGEVRQAAELLRDVTWHIEPVRKMTEVTRAKLALARGDIRGARSSLEAACTRLETSGLRTGLDQMLETLIECCIADGDEPAARRHLGSLESDGQSSGSPMTEISLQLSRARVLHDVDAARTALATAGEAGLVFRRGRAALMAGMLGDTPEENLAAAHRDFELLVARQATFARLTSSVS